MTYVSIPASAAGGAPAIGSVTGITATQIVFGSASDTGTSSADLTYDDTTNDLTLSVSESGGTVGATVANTSNTASSAVKIEARVAGTSAGDPSFRLNINGTQTWDILVANATSDELQIKQASTAVARVSVAGDWAIGGAPDSNHRLLVQDTGDAFLSMLASGAGNRANVAAICNAGETEAAVMRAGANDAASTLMGVNNALTAFFYAKSAMERVVVGGVKSTCDVIFAPGNSEKAQINQDGDWTYVDGADFSFGTTTGSVIGQTAAKMAFWGAAPVLLQVLATGAGNDAEDIIAFLQTIGLCKQS